MNRRQLLQFGALGLASGTTTRNASARSARAWHLRVEREIQELEPGLQASALALRVLTRGVAQELTPVTVDNAAGEPVRLRSAAWDRDLVLAAGARGECLMHGPDPVIGVVGRSVAARVRLAPAAAMAAIDAAFDLPIRHFGPRADPSGGARLSASTAYRHATLGERLRSAGEPLRVCGGQRVGLRFFNASPDRTVSLHLPGHEFGVCAVDGALLATVVRVAQLQIAPGERFDTVVEMRNPGRWVLGSLSRTEQEAGFGRQVEYAGARGSLVMPAPRPVRWSPSSLARRGPTLPHVTVEELLYDEHSADQRTLTVTPGVRTRLRCSNLGTRALSLGVRGHRFELRQWNGTEMRGLDRDVLALPPFARADIEIEPRGHTLELLTL